MALHFLWLVFHTLLYQEDYSQKKSEEKKRKTSLYAIWYSNIFDDADNNNENNNNNDDHNLFEEAKINNVKATPNEGLSSHWKS